MTRSDLEPPDATPPPTESERLLRQRESLCEVIESISSELELRPLLTRIVRHACELLDADDGAIGLYDEERDLIRTEAVYRMPDGELGAEIPTGVGLAGQVLLTREAVVLERYDMLPIVTVPELGRQAVVGLPILWRDRLMGFFGVGAWPPHRFDASDVETLALFARHAAIAIQNARQYEREAERNQRLALIARIGRRLTAKLDLDQLLQSAADMLHELLGYPNVGIGLIDPADPSTLVVRTVGGHFRRRVGGEHRFSISQGIMGAAARERRVQLVNDVTVDPRFLHAPGAIGIRAELAVPIQLGGDVLGVLNVEGGGRFTEEDASSLQIIADHLAVALKNTRLFEQTRRFAVFEERQRLARELHDSITQMLFSASLMSQSIAAAWRRDPAEGERLTERVAELTRSSLAEMRTLLRELMPADGSTDGADGESLTAAARLRLAGLADAIRHDVAQVAGAPLVFELDLDRCPRAPLLEEQALYRVFQEALHNVLKHARASCVRIRLALEADRVLLRIADDGVGFAADAPAARHGGIGLDSMRERLAAVGGGLTIRSQPGSGTTVEASLPATAEASP